ncbi:YciI family protein [Saccharopolyspora hirsuta]|nr:YciI family protein [Saccharopolyspora hirsuta]
MTAAPSGPELVEAMGDYDEQLVRAGVLLAGEVLHPSSAGFRTEVAEDGGRVVVRGPFAEAVIAGFWVLQVRSREEMVEWARRCPVPVTVLQVRAVEDVEVRFAAEIREFTG